MLYEALLCTNEEQDFHLLIEVPVYICCVISQSKLAKFLFETCILQLIVYFKMQILGSVNVVVSVTFLLLYTCSVRAVEPTFSVVTRNAYCHGERIPLNMGDLKHCSGTFLNQ